VAPGIRRRDLLGLGLGAMALPACRRAPVDADANGGSWRPLLMEPVVVSPPPSRGSAAELSELGELAALARRRGDDRVAQAIHFWSAGAAVRWDEVARGLVAHHRTPACRASRVYALVAVASYDALIAVWSNKYRYQRPWPSALSPELAPVGPTPAYPSYPSAHAAVAGASAAILSALYPDETEALAERANAHQESRMLAGLHFRSDVQAGDALGRAVAALAIQRARGDGADAVWKGQIPGQASWRCAPDQQPEAAQWGQVHPWFMKSGDQFRAPAPPPVGSPAFQAALAEVRRFSDARTGEQARTAALWADGVGSYTPPGRWNKIATDLCQKHRLSELRTGRVLALLNTALMDAGIACWDSKFHHWLLRPSQADPAITTPVGLPNFPSYTSAHAAFSGAGSAMLAGLFPAEASSLRASAEQAAFSRVLGGIHYRFDGDAGLAQGRAVAALALARAAGDGAR
jgi:membrane-associated phospholipid phosphatase